MISSVSRMIIRIQRLGSPPVFCALLKQTQESNYFTVGIGQTRFLSDDVDPLTIVKEAVKKRPVKTPEVPRITLLDLTDSITVTTKEKAEKIAASQNLRLVHVLDPEIKSQRPVYKLMTETQYLSEELKEKKKVRENKEEKKTNSIKGEKVMALSVRISENDLEQKIKKTLKWLEKRFEIRMVISGSANNSSEQETIYKKFEKAIQGNGRFVQKRFKAGDLKFQILPPKAATKENTGEKTNTEKKTDSAAEVVSSSS